jgi:hypothetical protein
LNETSVNTIKQQHEVVLDVCENLKFPAEVYLDRFIDVSLTNEEFLKNNHANLNIFIKKVFFLY